MNTYVFILCLFVFLFLTIGLSFLFYELYNAYVLNIKNGSYDKEIIEEYKKNHSKKKSYVLNWITNVFLLLAILVVIGLSICNYKGIGPRVVISGSMSYKNDKNTYLVENNLNDQLQVNDLLFIEKCPEQFNIYDIVVYKNSKSQYVLHRIVDKKIVNGEEMYITQGDANPVADEFLVSKNQITGIYKGKRIRYIGHFIRFIQSYAGMLCISLILFTSIAYPYLDKKITLIKNRRVESISSVKWRVRHEK